MEERYTFTIEEIHALNELKDPDYSRGKKCSKCTFCGHVIGKKYCRKTVKQHYSLCPEVEQYVAKRWTAADAQRNNAICNEGDNLFCNFCNRSLQVSY